MKIAKYVEIYPDSIILGVRDFSSKNVPFKSRFGGRTTSVVFKLVSNKKCSDTQTGLRGIPAKYIETALNVTGNHYEYEMNFLLEASRRKIRFVEIPIETIYLNKNKGSHFKTVQDSIKIYKVIFSFWINSMNKEKRNFSQLRFFIASLISFVIDFSILKLFLSENIRSSIFLATINVVFTQTI